MSKVSPVALDQAQCRDRCDAMIAIRAEIAAIESGAMDRANNPLKNAPHTAESVSGDEWTHPYTRQEAAYRFMSSIAGNWRNYEEANRALFAGDAVRFSELTESWPADVRDHARQLAFPRNA